VYDGCLWDVDRRTTFGDVFRGGKAGVSIFGDIVVGGNAVSVAIAFVYS
jgi:hypothetical protein